MFSNDGLTPSWINFPQTRVTFKIKDLTLSAFAHMLKIGGGYMWNNFILRVTTALVTVGVSVYISRLWTVASPLH